MLSLPSAHLRDCIYIYREREIERVKERGERERKRTRKKYEISLAQKESGIFSSVEIKDCSDF